MSYNLLRNQDTILDLPQGDSEGEEGLGEAEEDEEALPLRALKRKRKGKDQATSSRIYTQLLSQEREDTGSTENLIVTNTKLVDNTDQVSADDELKSSVRLVQSDGFNSAFMTIAPPLAESFSHHVVFVAHPSDQSWVTDLIHRLEMPVLGFKCWYQDRSSSASTTTALRAPANGIKNPLKTVIVISMDFLNDVWNSPTAQQLSSEDVLTLQKELIVMRLDPNCDIPQPLEEVVCIDVNHPSWWTKLIGQLCIYDDQISALTDECQLSVSASLQNLPSTAATNGYLLHSIKSRCIYCGQEMIDTSEVPQEILMSGVQITQEEYRAALHHLMKDSKFRCHVWCYNVPAALVFFILFLGVCLSAIPLLEAKYLVGSKQNGLEFVHGGVAWLCVLTVYMLVMQISKKKMKLSTYHRLRYVNAILSKHSLLAGVENLGMADCNKYYLHFFYFDIGPCLMYLQELFSALDDSSLQRSGPHTEVSLDIDCDTQLQSDNNGLGSKFTNVKMQTKAEELILESSGEYIGHLITKKIDRPLRQRHMKNYPCLCQYVEQQAYKCAS